jgi:hypothetical protein
VIPRVRQLLTGTDRSQELDAKEHRADDAA